MLAIPIDGTVIYVEPIYLESETSAYPELRLVAVMHNDNLSYGETFGEALDGFFQAGSVPAKVNTEEPGQAVANQTIRQLIDRANSAFENYLESMQQKNFNETGKALEELRQSLQQLSENGEKQMD